MQGSYEAHVAWAAALDRLESNLLRVTDYLACLEYCDCEDFDGIEDLVLDDTAWRVTADLPGQIPSALVPRAQSIAMRQGPARLMLLVRLEGRRSQPRPPQPRPGEGDSAQFESHWHDDDSDQPSTIHYLATARSRRR